MKALESREELWPRLRFACLEFHADTFIWLHGPLFSLADR